MIVTDQVPLSAGSVSSVIESYCCCTGPRSSGIGPAPRKCRA
jgi:hypothetical protein